MTDRDIEYNEKINVMIEHREDITCECDYDEQIHRLSDEHIPFIFYSKTEHGTVSNRLMLTTMLIDDTKVFSSFIIHDIDRRVKSAICKLNN